ncbi:hypothetical protein [Tranquillimonas alkanivorans]|uniref:Transmembrane protein n=1 Tax=Tranquillimonas alkanivorans TaxID=441119 RepID=A0A1I5VSG2_9RHOB|nr:hypothetical protein [Tranquillimonas alkanivorans]SFQ10405.1 hypothetical protein SAMN04488047_13511 [Tranquillimonas alkanivorans]
MTLPKFARAFIGGAVAFTLANIVSNFLFFQVGHGVLFANEQQSEKVIAVLFEMEPLPLMFTNGPLYLGIAALIGAVHGLVFFWVEPVLTRGVVRRGLSFAVILWALLALFFEFHTPFNMFGEPPVLVAVELAVWAIVLAVEGLVLSLIYGKSRQVMT